MIIDTDFLRNWGRGDTIQLSNFLGGQAMKKHSLIFILLLALLLTTAVEKVTRKKIDPKYEGYIHGVGMVLLLALMAIILFKDVFTIFKG